jgi:isoaspartyl peptidase/L-asparaginase-like protein (Ntn-hydrolase superfamily)
LIGSGNWADKRVAISCTGQGELFIRTAAAAQIAFRMRYGEPLPSAAATVLAQIAELGGEGGLAAVDHEGNVSVPHNAEGMKRAVLTRDGQIRVAVFD